MLIDNYNSIKDQYNNDELRGSEPSMDRLFDCCPFFR